MDGCQQCTKAFFPNIQKVTIILLNFSKVFVFKPSKSAVYFPPLVCWGGGKEGGRLFLLLAQMLRFKVSRIFSTLGFLRRGYRLNPFLTPSVLSSEIKGIWSQTFNKSHQCCPVSWEDSVNITDDSTWSPSFLAEEEMKIWLLRGLLTTLFSYQSMGYLQLFSQYFIFNNLKTRKQ